MNLLKKFSYIENFKTKKKIFFKKSIDLNDKNRES